MSLHFSFVKDVNERWKIKSMTENEGLRNSTDGCERYPRKNLLGYPFQGPREKEKKALGMQMDIFYDWMSVI